MLRDLGRKVAKARGPDTLKLPHIKLSESVSNYILGYTSTRYHTTINHYYLPPPTMADDASCLAQVG